MRDLLVILTCSIALMVGYALVMTLLRALLGFVDKVVDTTVALLFMTLVVPLLWLWHAGRRPLWRTLSAQQSRELQAWLRKAT